MLWQLALITSLKTFDITVNQMGHPVKKKRLTCLIAHAPHLECCLPILDRVAARGHVGVDLVLNRRMLTTDPEISSVLENSAINTIVRSRSYIELFSYCSLRRADAVLSYGDPIALNNRFRLKDRYLLASKTPSIFVQHGLIQEGVNLDSDWVGTKWYADLILWWSEQTQTPPAFINDAIKTKAKVVGFIKKNLMPPCDFPTEFLKSIEKFEKRILVCTSIPRRNKRFTEDRLTQLYRMLDDYCRRHPEHLILLRPHRARKASMGGDAVKVLSDTHENLMVMDRHSGPFAYSTMHHSLQLSDAVVAHASSAVLDALYTDQPTAVLQNDWEGLDGLPNIVDLVGLDEFIAASDDFDIKHNHVRTRFGEIETNLDRAAKQIETYMLACDTAR